ncbi:hypothetical protein [Streptomyces sp. NPDC059008]|uniref:hypothetical protein n=1 Tax=Streptomyces sp. NPDC059008 TaxID=3346693 RepID=UPI0036BEB14A
MSFRRELGGLRNVGAPRHSSGKPPSATAPPELRQAATANGDFAYYVDIATAMGDLPQPAESTTQWLDDAHTVHERWRALVTTRQNHLRSTHQPGTGAAGR